MWWLSRRAVSEALGEEAQVGPLRSDVDRRGGYGLRLPRHKQANDIYPSTTLKNFTNITGRQGA